MSDPAKVSPNVKGDGIDPKEVLDPANALVPAVQRVNEQRVAQGFWPKIGRVAAQIPFAGDVIAVWYCATDPKTPNGAKALMMAALAYFVLPLDAIPDFLPAIGYTDDAAVFAALIALVGRHLNDSHRVAADEVLTKLRAG